jgi:phosphonopyruvate decarboxylase
VISADSFMKTASALGFGLYAGVPCSYLKPFINFVIDAGDLRYVAAANEGDAVAIAAGVQLGGTRAVAMFQNSGLGNAVNPLTSLTHTFRIPVLLIPTLRGEPGGEPDEPQHALMGAITTAMLELMQIPWQWFPTREADVEEALRCAVAHMDAEGTPYALVMKKGSVAARRLETRLPVRATHPCGAGTWQGPASATRGEMLRAIQAGIRTTDIVLATTGYTGRELYACGDRDNQLYMVGSMGCVSSLGLGLALARPGNRVIVIDGDGALLMRMGALATIGYERPANMVHILLDNGMHESTGGQSTVSNSVDLCAVAAACGYVRTGRATRPEELEGWLADAAPGLAFLHVRIRPGVAQPLPRPAMRPEQIAGRLRDFLQRGPPA